MNNKLLSLLGIARRAGKLSLGCDAARDAALGGCPLILFAADLSPHTVRKVTAAVARGKTEMVTLHADMDAIGKAIGKRTGVIAVHDIGFAKKLLALNAEE
ncbi:MAG: 50S ribosomal protein L7ae [Oscillospiraceae bacterium]|jgi:ribosomal protein L7Ae-like RNA K-turn-binding protein